MNLFLKKYPLPIVMLFKATLLFVSLVVVTSIANAGILGEKITDQRFIVIQDNIDDVDTIYHGKVTVLMLWATWCPNCLSEISQLNNLASDFNGKIDIVGVEIDSSRGSVLQSIKTNNIKFKVLWDKPNDITRGYGLRKAIPQIIVINKNGIVVKHLIGPAPIDTSKFRKYLNDLAS